MPALRATMIPRATGPSLAVYRRGVDAHGQPCRSGGPISLRALDAAGGGNWSHLAQVEAAACYAGESLVWRLARAYSEVLGVAVSPETIRAAYSVTHAEAKRRRHGLYAPEARITPLHAEARDLFAEAHGPAEVARRLGIAPSTARRWRRQWRETSPAE